MLFQSFTLCLCGQQVTYPGHEILTETLSIPYGPDHYSAMKHDFRLQRITTTTPAKFTPSNNNLLLLDGGGAIARPTRSWLAVGLGLVAALRFLID